MGKGGSFDMVAGADRSNIGMVVPYLKESFNLTNTDIGAMASFFYIAYAVVQVPSGHLYGKYGVKKLFSLAVVLTSAATLIMGLANSGAHLKAARALLGFSEGPINIGCLSTINKWFPQQEKGIATGVFMASIKFAPAFVPPLCAWIIMIHIDPRDWGDYRVPLHSGVDTNTFGRNGFFIHAVCCR